MKIFKKSTVMLLILSLFLAYMPYKNIEAAVSVGENYTKVCDNKLLELYVNESTADFAVVNKKTGFILYSTPIDKDSDEFAKSVNKQSLFSQITVKYFQYPERKENAFVSSYIESVKKGKFEIEKLENGLRITYEFEKCGFIIPLKITLEEDYFTAEVELDRIVENLDEYKITDITVLPYLMSSNKSDKGYFMIPDGSGTIMNFNNEKRFADLIQCKVYGDNDIETKQAVKDNKEDIKLPVFGMSKNNNGAIAIIEDGDTNSMICGSVSGKLTSYNNLYVTFQIRDLDSLILGNPETVNYKEYKDLFQDMPDYDVAKIRYYFLDNGNDYVSMANKYRDYLIKYKNLEPKKQEDYPFMLNVYGGVKKKDSFLGIPITKTVPLTKYKDAISMLEILKGAGIEDIILRYNRWNKNDINHKLSENISFSREVGKKNDFSNLLKYINKEDISLYTETNYWKLGESSYNFFAIQNNASYNLSSKPSEQYYPKLSIYDKNELKPSWYLLAPRKCLEIATNNMKDLKENNISGISIDLSGNTLYRDYSENSKGSRYYTKQQIKNVVDEFKNNDIDIIARAANEYGTYNADIITDVSNSSSGYLMTDEDIPFYQIVYHGYIPMSSEPINFNPNFRDAFLKAIETGTILQYTFIYENSEILRDSELDFLYAANWEGLKEKAINQYLEAVEPMKNIIDKKIIAHTKLSDGVYETKYENGIKVIVNYNDEEYKAGNNIIPEKGFVYLGGDL